MQRVLAKETNKLTIGQIITLISQMFLTRVKHQTLIIGNSLPYSQNFNNNNNLFSFEELKNLTLDLISNLRKCKTREEQFQVVTNLACKFLYQ